MFLFDLTNKLKQKETFQHFSSLTLHQLSGIAPTRLEHIMYPYFTKTHVYKRCTKSHARARVRETGRHTEQENTDRDRQQERSNAGQIEVSTFIYTHSETKLLYDLSKSYQEHKCLSTTNIDELH